MPSLMGSMMHACMFSSHSLLSSGVCCVELETELRTAECELVVLLVERDCACVYDREPQRERDRVRERNGERYS